jgi:S-adenosylmethionine decarboxylase
MACGRHIILECYDCDDELLKQEKMLEQQLIHSAEFAQATVLHSYFHKFGEGEGVTGVIALAESHISVHTWPEYGYMAIDIFMCGECNPMDSVDYIISNLDIGQFEYQEFQRGEQFQFSRTVTYAAE